MKNNYRFASLFPMLLLFVFTALNLNFVNAQPGANDASFNPGLGANNTVFPNAIQSDGKVIIGGYFTSYNGSSRNRIARLNTDGSLDASFNPGAGSDGNIWTIAIQSDGKILIGGSLTSYNGTARSRLARLNSDGTLDATFDPGSGGNGDVNSISIQGDGKIIIGGIFSTYNGTTRNRIARLNTDGTLDATFNPAGGADNSVRSTAIQSDGKIIIGGNFTSYDGTAQNYIARVNADGTLDATFNPGLGANNNIYSTTIQSDGKAIVGGEFTTYNGTARNRVARLNTDGSLDATFSPGSGADGQVLSIALQSDGKIIIVGSFTNYDGVARNRIARLNVVGSLDATFNPGTGASSIINSLAIQGDGKIIIGGWFTSYNGTGRNQVARVLGGEPTPTITSFSPSIGPVGTLVTIIGTNLSNTTAFNIGGVSAISVSNTGTTLVGMVMPSATTGIISITTAGGTVLSASNFTVTPTPFPSAQQGSKLVGTGNTGTAVQGRSIAVSADGNTAIVGGPTDNSDQGAVWVYTRSGTTWTQQGSKLVGAGNVGAAQQGWSVALSADGNTAIVGGYTDNSDQGAVWVYTRSGTTWTQQGSKLVGTGNVGAAQQGSSVAISADGNTAIVGGEDDNSNQGAAWVFTRSGTTWSQQGSKLVGTGGTAFALQGISVALSADGNSAIVGGNGDNSSEGAAWVFTRSGSSWSQQGSKLVGTGNIGAAGQGYSVALSADGNTAIVGGYADNSSEGAAWVFTRSVSTWTQQGSKLVGTGNVGAATQGNSVALSADGNTVIVGGPYDFGVLGAVWVFTRNGSTWTQQGSKLVGTGNIGVAGQGMSVALSANGNTAMVGGFGDNSFQGAAWVFVSAPPPTITSFSPSSGSVGTLVTIIGTNLSNTTAFNIGGVSAISVSNTGTTLVGMVMPGAVTGAVSVTTLGGTATAGSNFTVTPTPFPGIQQGSKLVGTGNTGAARQGNSVAVSADGNTAIVGGIFDNSSQGAAWVYTRSGTTWSQQGSKLVGTGNIGAAEQGSSVALSADGNTAIMGGYADNSNQGAAWVFTRSGSTWSQQGLKLVGTGNTGAARQGNSVALSADGNTAIMGGYADNSNQGAAWVFTRSGSTWSQQGLKLVGTGNTGAALQGFSVALSADGNTSILSGHQDNTDQGAAWVFTRSGSTWSQQGSKLVGTGNTGGAGQGFSVALSADGNTAIIGGPGDNANQGAAWVFTRSGSIWTQQGSKLVGTGNIGFATQGISVALSADGNTSIMGGTNDNGSRGATWVFTRSGSVWSQQGLKLVGTGNTGNALQGCSVALSADGNTTLVGGYFDNSFQGASWVFIPSPPPTITSFTPSSGCSSSTSIVITGTNFTGATSVTIGGIAVASFIVNSATQITATVGTGSTGAISITTAGGNGTSGSSFIFNPNLSPSVSIAASTNNVCSGTSITITATPTNGGASPTYDFKVNGITVQNTTSNTYTSTGFVNADAVTCVMTSNAPCASPITATSNSVTINISASVVPAVSIAASTNNVCSGTSITITANPTNGGASPTYDFKVNGITVQNTTSNTFTTTGFVNADAVTCIMTSNSSCASPLTANSAILNMIINVCAGINAWTGAVSNVWSNTGNWSLGVLPGNGDDFLIPNSALQNPVISTNLAPLFNDITIESSRNLIVNANASIQIDGILNNSGTITVNSGGSLVQTINSTLAGAGNYNVKRAIPSGQRFFGSPIQNQNVGTIGISATGSNGAQVIPVQTPSPFRCNADSVAVNSPYGNIMEMTENAIPIDNCAQSLWTVKSLGNYSSGRGYAAYANTATTLNFNGTVNNGVVSYTGLTRQAGLIDQWNGPQTRGWHIVSNPYPSPIRLTNGDLGPDFDNAVYLFDGTSFSSVSLNVTDAVIAVGQGFQIRKSVVGGSADFTLNNSYREAGNPTFFSQNSSITQYMNLILTGNNQQKSAMIYFDANASSAFDPQYDANCLFGVPSASLIYTTEQNGEILSVDARPDLASNPQQTIPIGIYDAVPGNFQLSFESISTIGQPVFLEDLKLNTFQPITDSSIYSFTTVSGDARDRFLLHFLGNPTSIKNENHDQVSLFPNPTNQNTSLLLNGGQGFNTVEVIDVSGRTVLSKTINKSENLITLNTLNLTAGVYFVKLMGASQHTIKFIKY